MGSDQSILAEGASGNSRRTKQLASNYSTARPIGAVSGSPAFRSEPSKSQPSQQGRPADTRTVPKHNIIVVADGSVPVKDPDPELTRLNTIPTFLPIIKSSLTNNPRDLEMLDQLDHRSLLKMALRYQEHLKQLSEAVAFDQNALCIRIKEIAYLIHMINGKLAERQKRYHKYIEQFGRVTEMVTTLNRVKVAMDDITPTLDHLNQLLPASEQLEPFTLMPRTSAGNNSIQCS